MAMPPEVKELAAKVRNWGRWGDDDEIGTLNLITDNVVQAAAKEIRNGKRLALGLPLDEHGPQTGANPGRDNPVREMVLVDQPLLGDPADFTTSDDKVAMGIQAGTHWDALAHVSYEGNLYNGVKSSEVITAAGASRMGIDKIKTIVGRGVLLDVAKAKGVDRIEGNYPLTAADLDAACDLGKVQVQAGDIVLIRTGQMQLFFAGDRDAYTAPCSGPSLQTVEWFHAHDVAAVATDNLVFECYPSEREDAMLAVHLLHLVDMGMTQGQNWNLEELSKDCAADGRYSFFLDASPMPFTHAVGSPVNPIVVK